MTTLPSKTNLTGASTTEGAFRTALDDLIDYLTENFDTVGGGVVNIVNSTGITSVPLTVKGIASQTANILRVRDSADNDLLAVDPSGNVLAGTTDTSHLMNVGGKVQSRATVPGFELHDGTYDGRLEIDTGELRLEGPTGTTLRISGPAGANLAGATIKIAGVDETILTTAYGALVTADNTVTLTNKTFDLTDNTLQGTRAEFNAAMSDDDFATLAGTETLLNKTLTAPVIGSIVNTGTLTLPTATDTLVGRATTDTLSNKSIALGSNTLSGTLAQFNAAVSDADLASLAGAETLSNKTLASPAFSGTATAFRSTGIDDNADTLSLLIDASERVVMGDTTSDFLGALKSVTISTGNSGHGAQSGKSLLIENSTSAYIVMGTPNTAAAGIQFYDGGYVGAMLYDHTDDHFHFSASGTTDVIEFGANLLQYKGFDIWHENNFTVQGQYTLDLPASAFAPHPTSGPSSARETTATNGHTLDGWDFDPSTAEDITAFIPAMPKSWNLGSIVAQVTWKDADTAGTGNVVWYIAMLAVGDSDPLDAAASGSNITADAFLTAGDLHRTAESGGITPAGSPTSEDGLIVLVRRAAGNASDTYNQDARFMGLKLHYTTNANTDD